MTAANFMRSVTSPTPSPTRAVLPLEMSIPPFDLSTRFEIGLHFYWQKRAGISFYWPFWVTFVAPATGSEAAGRRSANSRLGLPFEYLGMPRRGA